MNAQRWLLLLAALSMAAAVAAIYALTEPWALDERPAAATAPEPPASREVLPSYAGAPTPAAEPVLEAKPADAGAAEIQPPGSMAVFDNPDDRAASLQAVQKQRFDGAMDALNRRAARRAAMAGAGGR